MKTVGVRDLKAHLSEFLRQLQEDGEVIEVSNHGEIVARLVPVNKALRRAENSHSVWTDLEQLAAEIGASLPPTVDAVQAINDVRRDL